MNTIINRRVSSMTEYSRTVGAEDLTLSLFLCYLGESIDVYPVRDRDLRPMSVVVIWRENGTAREIFEIS